MLEQLRMRLAIFDTHRYDREIFTKANEGFGHDLVFFEPRLFSETASLAKGFPAVCSFVHDRIDPETLRILKNGGVQLIALRSAGFNHVDLVAAKELVVKIVRVPAYSPHAVAEHAIALVLALNRKLYRAYNRVREANFSLEGLMGFDLFGKTVGILGTGKIGAAVIKIFHGLGCRILCYDLNHDSQLVTQYGVHYVGLDSLYRDSDILSLHLPLTPETQHLINKGAIAKMKQGVILINTGRGGLIDTPALINGLKSGRIGAAGLDVYEEEDNIFYRDLSDQVLQDDVLARLLTFPNVLITSHQGYFTREALIQIAQTTLQNVSSFEKGGTLKNEVSTEKICDYCE